MTRNEYLDELRRHLAALDPDDAARAVDFYDEAIADRLEAGESEEEAVAELEPPAQAASRILEELPAVPRTFARLRAAELSGAMRGVLLALVILGSPLWLSLVVAALAVVLCGFLVLGCALLVVWIFTVLLLLAAPFGIFLLVTCIGAGSVPLGLVWGGAGLALGGIGIIALRLATLATGSIARAIVWLARKVASPFMRVQAPVEGRSATPPRSQLYRDAWRIATIVALALVAVGGVAGLAGYAGVGFSPTRLELEGQKVEKAVNPNLEGRGWRVWIGENGINVNAADAKDDWKTAKPATAATPDAPAAPSSPAEAATPATPAAAPNAA